MARWLAITCLALTLAAPAASALPRVARVDQCGLPPAHMALGPESFTEMWRASTQGLTGGDAALSALLPDGRVLWAFGDSFVGGLRPDGTRPVDWPVVRNTLVIQSGNCLSTLFRGTLGHPSAYLPAPEDPYKAWYWPNQPIVRARDVVIFLTHVHRTGPGGWSFRPDGTAVAVLRLPDLRLKSIRRIRVPSGMYFGVAVVRRGASSYVLGADERGPGPRGLVVARVRGDLTRGRWGFWDGHGWSGWARHAAAVLAVPSSQFSVVDGATGLVLVAKDGMNPDVFTFLATRVTGPWTKGVAVARIPPLPGLLTYNAALHPHFSAGDEMLLSYSVNCASNTLDEVHRQPWHYLPRFTTARLTARAR